MDNDPKLCHPERSEGSECINNCNQILRFAQNDMKELIEIYIWRKTT